MSGLLDLFGGEDPQQQGLLGLTAGILGASGPSRMPVSLGQVLGAGLGGFQQGKQQAQAQQLGALRMKALQSELADQEQMRQQERSIQEAAKASMISPEQQSLANGGGPTLENAARIHSLKGGFDADGFVNRVMAVNPLKGMEYQKMFAKAGPEFDTKPQVGVDAEGKPFQYILAKDGTMKRLDGVLPREKLHFLNTGGRTVGVNDYTGEQISSIANTLDPGALLSAATQRRGQDITARGQNMVDARQREMNAIARDNKQKAADQTKAGQVASFDTMLDSLDRLSAHPGLSRSVGLYSRTPTIPGSDSANFQAELETFKSQAFIPMVAQLKGMGALSDAEGRKLTAAVGALDPKMSESAFRSSIDRIKKDMDAARARVAGSSRADQGTPSDIAELLNKYGSK